MRIFKITVLLLALITISTVFVRGGDTSKIVINIKGFKEGSRVVANLLSSEQGLLENKTVYSDAFSFENVTVGKEYFVLILYNGVTYGKHLLMNNTVERVEFTVFEVTSDDADVTLSFHKVVLGVKGSALNMVEVLIYKNNGAQVYNGTLHVALPPTYENLNTSIMGCCIEKTIEGFTVTNLMEVVKPNDLYQVTVSYTIHPTTGEYVFIKKTAYPTSTFMILVEKVENTQLKDVSGLVSGSTIDFEGKNYNLFTASNLQAAEAISFTLSGFTATADLTTMWIGASLIAAVVAALGFITVRFRGQSTENLLAKKDAVFSVLDRLERDLKEGKIGEEEYEELRTKYKEEGAKILKEIDELEKQGDAE